MNKALSFARLDYITIKPYLTLKNLLIFSMVGIIMLVTSGTGVSAIAIIMVYAALYVSYPFAVGEKNGIDALYTTLSISRKTVVLGRYLFAYAIILFSGIFAFLLSFVALTLMQKDFNFMETIASTVAIFLVYGIIQALQLPIFFKLGYAKAKMLSYLPLVGMPLVVVFLSKAAQTFIPSLQIESFYEWIEANFSAAAIAGIAVWLVVVFISFALSLKFYDKRDF